MSDLAKKEADIIIIINDSWKYNSVFNLPLSDNEQVFVCYPFTMSHPLAIFSIFCPLLSCPRATYSKLN